SVEDAQGRVVFEPLLFPPGHSCRRSARGPQDPNHLFLRERQGGLILDLRIFNVPSHFPESTHSGARTGRMPEDTPASLRRRDCDSATGPETAAAVPRPIRGDSADQAAARIPETVGIAAGIY